MRSTFGPAVGFAVASLVGALSLAACGGGGGGGTAAQSTAPSTPPTTTPTTSTRPAGAAGKGQQMAEQSGCENCHTLDGSASTGPTWKGLYGSQVKLDNGKTVTASEQYLIQSIEQPDAQIVAGYSSGLMSSTIPPGSVSMGDAKAIVAYLKTLK
jgi:hypothetical protein